MDNSVGGILGSAMDSIMKTMGDNCTIGNPIETKSGTIIIPVSKISVGFGGGGSDFGSKTKDGKYFGGGGGTGITATPVGFLVVTNDGKITFTTVDSSTPSNQLTVDSLIAGVSEVVDKIKAKFPKKGEDKKTETQETSEEEKVENEDK